MEVLIKKLNNISQTMKIVNQSKLICMGGQIIQLQVARWLPFTHKKFSGSNTTLTPKHTIRGGVIIIIFHGPTIKAKGNEGIIKEDHLVFNNSNLTIESQCWRTCSLNTLQRLRLTLEPPSF